MSNAAMYRCNKEWMSRPDDERYLSLDEMFDHFVEVREQSREITYPSKLVDVRATEDDDMVVRGIGRDGPDRSLNNWSFDQMAQLSGSLTAVSFDGALESGGTATATWLFFNSSSRARARSA